MKARKEVDRLIAELQDAQFKLEVTPTTTIEFVNTLSFLDDIQVRVSQCQVKSGKENFELSHSKSMLSQVMAS